MLGLHLHVLPLRGRIGGTTRGEQQEKAELDVESTEELEQAAKETKPTEKKRRGPEHGLMC